MPFVVSPTDQSVGKLRRTAWPFQRTFHTPLQDLRRFSTTLLSGVDNLQAVSAHVQAIVFEPKVLNELLTATGTPAKIAPSTSIRTTEPDQAARLLEACLGCWIDFFFVPEAQAVHPLRGP